MGNKLTTLEQCISRFDEVPQGPKLFCQKFTAAVSEKGFGSIGYNIILWRKYFILISRSRQICQGQSKLAQQQQLQEGLQKENRTLWNSL